MVVGETSGIKTQRASRETCRSLRMVSSTIATVSLQVDGIPLGFLSWNSVLPNATSRHHFWMLFLTIHDSPYTPVNSWWISFGVLPFAFKNWITALTSHFAVVLSGTSITKGCQAKTKRSISVCANLDGVGEWGNQHTQQCCQQLYKQFHSALETSLLESPLHIVLTYHTEMPTETAELLSSVNSLPHHTKYSLATLFTHTHTHTHITQS